MSKHCLLIATLLALMPACSKEQGTQDGPCFPDSSCNGGLVCTSERCTTAAPPSTATRVSSVTSVAECPNGGQKIDLGIDGNLNGTLEDEEVDQTIVVCNGIDGHNGADGQNCTVADGPGAGEHTVTCGGTSVVVVDGADGADGASGTSCSVENGPNAGEHTVTCGGTSVVIVDGDAGADGAPGTSCSVENGPNAGEHTVTCGGTSVVVVDGADGAPGNPGSNGPSSLVHLEPELGGPRCPYSGTRILAGVDDDRDGLLDGDAAGVDEVDEETVLCSTDVGPCAPSYDHAADGRCLLAESHTVGLLGYWPFDGDGDDVSGAQRHLALFGGAGFASGLLGDALDLHGDASQFAARPVNDPEFDFGSADFTVQAWVRFSGSNSIQNVVEKFTGTDGPGWTFAKLTGGEAHFFSAPSAVLTTNGLGLTNLTWHHLVARRSGEQFAIIVDGVAVTTGSSTQAIAPSPQPLLIGRRNAIDPRSFPMEGQIDEVAIWSRALGDDEIATLYAGGAGRAVVPH